MGSSATGPIARSLAVDVMRCVGPDAVTFLQGQLSQDISGTAVGSSAWSFLLAPQGKVIAWIRVHRIGPDDLLLEVAEGSGEAMATRLARFKMRVDCVFGAIESWRCVEIRGEGAATVAVPAGALSCASVWPGEPGIDLIGQGLEIPEGVAADADEVERRRILAGVPQMGSELDESVIPAEAGPWLIELSASFDKGCYVGQELVARVDSRGSNTPRRLRGVRSRSPIEAGHSLVDGDGKTVGRVTSVLATSDGGTVGLAYVGRAVDVPGSVGGVDVFEVPVSA